MEEGESIAIIFFVVREFTKVGDSSEIDLFLIDRITAKIT
jgi:hypothetical protein